MALLPIGPNGPIGPIGPNQSNSKLTGLRDGAVHIWTIADDFTISDECVYMQSGHDVAPSKLVVLSNNLLAIVCDDNEVCVLNTYNGECINIKSGSNGHITSLAALSDGGLVIGHSDGSIRVWK